MYTGRSIVVIQPEEQADKQTREKIDSFATVVGQATEAKIFYEDSAV